MLDPLGLLLIVFAAMSAVAVIAIILLFLMKDEKKKKWVVYVMAALGMYIAWANAQSSPLPQFLGEAIFGWMLGALGAVGLLLQACGKTKKQLLAAKILVVVSVVAGILELFLH